MNIFNTNMRDNSFAPTFVSCRSVYSDFSHASLLHVCSIVLVGE